jgi:hypothetical protein
MLFTHRLLHQQTLLIHIQNEAKTTVNCLRLIGHAFSPDLAQWIYAETRHLSSDECLVFLILEVGVCDQCWC